MKSIDALFRKWEECIHDDCYWESFEQEDSDEPVIQLRCDSCGMKWTGHFIAATFVTILRSRNKSFLKRMREMDKKMKMQKEAL